MAFSAHVVEDFHHHVKSTKVIRNSNRRDEELHVELRRSGSKGRPSEAGRQRQPSGRGEGGGQADKYFSPGRHKYFFANASRYFSKSREIFLGNRLEIFLRKPRWQGKYQRILKQGNRLAKNMKEIFAIQFS